MTLGMEWYAAPPADGGDSRPLRPTSPAISAQVTVRDATGTFLPLLARLGCSLALSTDGSRLILFGPGQGTPAMTALVIPDLRGVAAQGDLLAVGSAAGIHIFHARRGLAAAAPHAPGRFDAVYVPRALHYAHRCDLHDMAFVGGRVVAVNTRYSCICTIDGQFTFTPLWRPSFITALRPEDRCHLNGMALFDGELRYVTMLGRSDHPSGWRESFVADGGVLMEAATGRVVADGLSLPHSPRILGGRLLCLESGRGHLLGIDPETGERTVLARLPGFTHGLVEHGGVLFVGVSKLRARRPREPIPLEREGIEPICAVVALDAQTFAEVARLEIASGAEEVYDLQLLRGVRSPEIRGADAAGAHGAIDLPGEAFWVTDPEAREEGGDDPLPLAQRRD